MRSFFEKNVTDLTFAFFLDKPPTQRFRITIEQTLNESCIEKNCLPDLNKIFKIQTISVFSTFRLKSTPMNCKYGEYSVILNVKPKRSPVTHLMRDGTLKYQNEYYRHHEYCINR